MRRAKSRGNKCVITAFAFLQILLKKFDINLFSHFLTSEVLQPRKNVVSLYHFFGRTL